MAGRSIDLKKTVRLHELDDMHSYSFGSWGLGDIQEETKNDRELEAFREDVIEPCVDIPFCFTPGPSRTYNVQYVPLYEHRRPKYMPFSHNNIVVSAYKPFLENIYINYAYINNKYTNTLFNSYSRTTVLMIADGTFAGAVYKEGNMVASKEIVSRKTSKTSKSEKEDFRQRVKDLLHKWDSLIESTNFVFVRCTYDDKLHFFEGKGNTADSKFRHIPFVTGKPTLKEVDRVYDRLTRCVIHGNIEETLKEVRNQKRTAATVESVDVDDGNKENKRRLEKKMWPWMDSNLAKRLYDNVENDDGNGLYDDVQAHSKKSQLIEYFNCCHDKYNNGTFLHFAVQKDAHSVVEILLELGCDPTVSDAKNKVPFDYCRTKDIQEVFTEFRSQYPDLFNWNKANIPERGITPLHNERKREIETPKKSDVSRKKRSEKLRNKKVKSYEY